MLTAVLNQTELLIAALIERYLVLRPHFQPGDLEPLLKRQLWLSRVRLPRGAVAPNRFMVCLDAVTHDDFRPILAPLAEELAVSLETYCNRMKLERLGEFRVAFERRETLRRGQVEIHTALEQPSEDER